jgi:hypothetical protein
MTRSSVRLFAAAMILVAAGCPGVEVSRTGASANLPPPDGLNKRAVYSGVMSGYNFQDVVGCILKVRPDGSASILDVFIPDTTFKVSVKLYDKPGNWYQSRIQKVKAVKLNCPYLAFVADMAERAMVYYSLADDAEATGGKTTHEWMVALGDWAERNRLVDPSVHRLWVRGVVRSVETRTQYDSVGANAGAQYGELVGVNGTVYRRSEQSSCSWVYGLDVIDVDSVATRARAHDIDRLTADEVWERYRYTGPLYGTLKLP